MTNKELVLETLKRSGKLIAETVQAKSENMTGTQLYDDEEYIPAFKSACEKMNMLERNVGFVCKSSAGRVVKLIQKYDSSIYTGEPEELSAQWGFVWSTDPAKALPFISFSTSPYNTGDCCSLNETVYKSKIDNNVWSPTYYPEGWEEI